MNVDFSFPKRLKEMRLKRGLTQKQLSEESNCPQNKISDYENEKGMPTLSNAANLAQALGVSLDYLCGIDNDVQDITPRQWILYTLKLMDNPPMYTDETNQKYRITGHKTGRYENGLAYNQLYFLGEDLNKFFNAYFSLKSAMADIDANMFSEFVNTLVGRYEQFFVPGNTIAGTYNGKKKEG